MYGNEEGGEGTMPINWLFLQPDYEQRSQKGEERTGTQRKTGHGDQEGATRRWHGMGSVVVSY
jgi:hypothetical protein